MSLICCFREVQTVTGVWRPHLNHWRESTMKVGTSTIAIAISAILISAAPLAARAQTDTAAVSTGPGKVGVSETMKMTATVLSIDMGSRDVLLMDSQGK